MGLGRQIHLATSWTCNRGGTYAERMENARLQFGVNSLLAMTAFVAAAFGGWKVLPTLGGQGSDASIVTFVTVYLGVPMLLMPGTPFLPNATHLPQLGAIESLWTLMAAITFGLGVLVVVGSLSPVVLLAMVGSLMLHCLIECLRALQKRATLITTMAGIAVVFWFGIAAHLLVDM